MKRILLILCFLLALLPSLCFGGSNASSGLTAQDFITRVRVDLNAPSSKDTFYSDAEFIQWINEAIEAAVSLTKCMETSEIVVLSSGVSSYALSSSHYDISHVVYDSGVEDSPTRFYFLARVAPGMIVGTQEPRPKLWWEWQSRIFIYPVPDSAISGTTLAVYEVAKHSQITSAADTISTPAYMDLPLVFYLKAKAYYKERSEEKGTFYMNLFNSVITNHKREIIRRETLPEPVRETK